MATSLADDATREQGVRSANIGLRWGRAEMLWTLFGVALLVGFLVFVIDDYALGDLIAVR